MKRALLALALTLWPALSASAEVTISAGGELGLDSSVSGLLSPRIDATLLGDHSWLPSDRVGLFGSLSAASSYEPTSGAATGLFMSAAEGSYLSGRFLSRLSLSGVASLSTVEELYAAGTGELLFSYGDPGFSLFVAPSASLISDSGTVAIAGGKVGAALLISDTLLVKPQFEAGVSLPGGAYTQWYINPAFTVDQYSGGAVTWGLAGGYKKSSSSRLDSLVAGGPLLPLDTYDRLSLAGTLLWIAGRGVSLDAELPVEYTAKSYQAFEGNVALGVAAWLVSAEPAAALTLAASETVDLVVSLKGLLAFSNNSVERRQALSAGLHLELHPR